MPEVTEWVGREKIERDVITLTHARRVAALLDQDPEHLTLGTPLPACWHWFLFHPTARRSEWGEDGHPRRGTFLPPITLPRRMWAGGRLRFHAPIGVGDGVERQSRIASVEEKEGRGGKLVLVTVRHCVSGPSGVAVEEEQDLIYRDASKPGDQARTVPFPGEAQWTDAFQTDTVLLFHFSALTGNGHRVHYDHPYATQVEGYPGLLVHGPLTSLLLFQAAQRRAERRLTSYAYRAVALLYVGEPITLAGVARADGRGIDVWAGGPRGLVMQGSVQW